MKRRIDEVTVYNVCCMDCGGVFQPQYRSPLWWAAKQSSDKGRLDAITVRGERCGCVPAKKVVKPDAPFRVFGYNCFCEDFDIPCFTFTEAILTLRKATKDVLATVFISGISNRVWQEVLL